MKKILLCLMFLILVPSVYAVTENGHIYLLAVKESGGVYDGSVADLYLEIRPGNGRVFIETFPLSKLDTQISTRFAQEIACDYLDFECGDYDFFYTIRADSTIVGGPSAGAATAVLTAAMLSEIDIRDDVAITGTINSGGLIGPVGGLRAKTDAASMKKVKTLLLPKGASTIEAFNLSVDLSEYALKYNMSVFEVSDLADALFYFTGKRVKEETKELVINQEYLRIMKSIAEGMCGKSYELNEKTGGISGVDVDAREKALNLSSKGEEAFENKEYYSSASYCFGSNVFFRTLYLERYEVNSVEKMLADISKYDSELKNRKIETITDLEAYMIVKDRIKEAIGYFNKSIILKEEGRDYSKELAYGIERVYAAEAWSSFFGAKGKKFDFKEEDLKESCSKKISEAEERLQYVELFLTAELREAKEGLEDAYEDYGKGDYGLCLHKASKAKAEINVIVSVIGVKEEDVDDILDTKLAAVRRIIAEEQAKGIFPILGYSYYEYANSLKEHDKYSSLLYAEYALELSKLDMYFKEERFKITTSKQLTMFILGFASGFFIAYGLFSQKKAVKRKR